MPIAAAPAARRLPPSCCRVSDALQDRLDDVLHIERLLQRREVMGLAAGEPGHAVELPAQRQRARLVLGERLGIALPAAVRAAALGIIARLEDRRQALPGAWAICSSSNEGFDTSSVIRPVFAEVAADPAIRAAGAGGAFACAGMAFALVALRRARDRTPGSQP